MPYRQLDDARITRTLERLNARISERFPGSGLSGVAKELLAVGRETLETVEYLRKPDWAIRVPAGLALLIMVGVPFALMLKIRVPAEVNSLGDLVQLIDAGINDIVFLGIAIFFLITVESRFKRKRALKTIHELRSLAHVVDMHQLTKDPERLFSTAAATPSSPERSMSAADLARYLDYCSELLSLNSKLAALLVQYFNDEVVLGAVNEIEALATGLSGKIWQKITLLDRIRGELKA